MNKDLADCTASDKPRSAEACTRVMDSGRLPKEQFYIGFYNRGWSHKNAGDLDKARDDFDTSLKHKPNYADTYYSRALVLHDLGERDKSLEDLDRYSDLKPKDWLAFYNRAVLFRERGDYDQALTDLEKAADFDGKQAKVPTMRALVLSDAGRNEEARQEIDNVVADYPNEAGAFYARAVVHHKDHQLEAATSDLRTALALKAEFVSAQTLMGKIMEERGDADSAKSRYRRATEAIAKSREAKSAQKEARQRLADLGEETAPAASPTLASNSKSPSTSKKTDTAATTADSSHACRRFFPSVGMTIPVDCGR